MAWTAQHLGFDQWAVSAPGQLLKVPVTATSEAEAIEKAQQNKHDKPIEPENVLPAETTPKVTPSV